MSKSKRARFIKPRSKTRSKTTTRKLAAPHHGTRAISKQALSCCASRAAPRSRSLYPLC
jgi:hypothetical protein